MSNTYCFQGVLEKGARIVGLGKTYGGHFSHGFQIPKHMSFTADLWEWMHYTYDHETGLFNYDEIQEVVTKYRPKMLISGYSMYPRHYDYKRMKEIADSVGAYLLSDMAHISGLVCTGNAPNCFEHSDIVTSTTHKTLQGARGSFIFFRKGVRKHDKKGKPIMYDLETKINDSVFPGHQGGPHSSKIAGIGIACKIAKTPEFKDYVDRCIANSRKIAEEFMKRNYHVNTFGTDNHMNMIDVRHKGTEGLRAENFLERLNISLSKTMTQLDNIILSKLDSENKAKLTPGGFRIGTPCITARGFGLEDCVKMVDIIDRSVELCAIISKESGEASFQEFKEYVDGVEDTDERIQNLKKEVVEFVSPFFFVPWMY